jgi:hypothetical protein
MLFEMLNQQSEVVMTWNTSQFFRVRDPGAAFL